MATLIDLATRLKALPATLALEGSRCAVEVALALESNLVTMTPVDTSNALSNWQGALNDPILNEIEPYFPGQKGDTRRQSGQAAYDELKRKLKDKKPGQIIFISNNAPYIRDLNSGTSRQAPAGFVNVATILARMTIANFKLRLR